MFEVLKVCPLCASEYIRHDDWDISLYTKFDKWYPMTVVLPDMIIDYQLGLSVRQLVKKYGFNHKNILNQLKKAGVSMRPTGRTTFIEQHLTKERLDEYYKK